MKPVLLILLGGSGTRFGAIKQFLPVSNEILLTPARRGSPEKMPLFEATLRQLLAFVDFEAVVIAANDIEDQSLQDAKTRLSQSFNQINWVITAGGSTRHLSFRAALEAAKNEYSELGCVLIHDANRPYLSEKFLQEINTTCKKVDETSPCYIPVIAVADSVVKATSDNVVAYENREELFRVQTPQILYYPAIAAYFKELQADSFTDEGSMVLAMNLPVKTYEGDAGNTKITYKEDLK